MGGLRYETAEFLFTSCGARCRTSLPAAGSRGQSLLWGSKGVSCILVTVL